MKINQKEKRATIRMPASLYGQLTEIAKYNGRSLNAEVLARLQAVAVNDQFSKLSKEMAEMKKMLKELLDKS